MAKGVNKTISIFVNGKEVENNIKSIREAMAQLVNQQNKMTVGSKEYVEHSKKIRELRQVINEHNNELKKTGSTLDWLKQKGSEFQGMFQSLFFVKKGGDYIKNLSQEYTDAYAAIDKVMATTQRATGKTREEVEQLNEEFKKFDTTTPVEQLHKLAAIGAKLGYNTTEEIKEFTEAADKIKVVFGEDFDIAGLTKLVKTFGEDDNLGIRGALMATGSALGKMSRQTGQSAQDLMDFTTKVGVLGKEAGFTQSEIIGLGATLSAKLQDAGTAGTVVNRLITKMYTDTSKFAKAAGVDVKTFSLALKEDANKALLDVIETLNKKGGLDKLQPMLKDLGLGGKASSVMTAIATSIDDIRKNQTLANETYEQGTGIINSFNIANETNAAKLEKSKNKIIEAKQELGERLMPVMVQIAESTANTTKFLAKNIDVIAGLAAAYAAYFVIKNKDFLLDKAKLAIDKMYFGFKSKAKRESIAQELAEKAAIATNTAATETNTLANMRANLEKTKGVAAIALKCDIVAQEARVLAADTAAIAANTAATRAMNVAKAATPWSAILTALLMIVPLVKSLAGNQSESSKAMKEFNKEAAVQTHHAKDLFDRLGKLKKGTEEYNSVQKQIIDTYPELLKNQIDEHGNLINLKDAYDLVTKSIEGKIAAQKLSEAKDKIIEASIDKQLEYLKYFTPEIQKVIKALAEEGKTADEILTKVNEKLAEPIKKTTKMMVATSTGMDYVTTSTNEFIALLNIVDEIKKTRTELNATDKQFAPWIPEKELTELDKLESQLKELNNQKQLLFDATGSTDSQLEKQISDVRKQIEKLKKETAEPITKPAGGGYTPTDEPDEKSIKKWEAFNKKVNDLADDRRQAVLIGFEKERDQIVTKYDELIAEAKKFGEKGKAVAEQLEKEKGEAVIAAGEKYLKDYSDKAKKLQEEIMKLAEKTPLNTKESELVKSLLGSEKEWNEKIKAINVHLEELEKMYGNATSDAERENIRKKMVELYDAELEAVKQQGQAKVNIINNYAAEITEFAKQQTDEQYLNSLKGSQREIELIKRKYKIQIDAAKQAITELNKAGNADPKEIKRLEELIKKLEQLRDNEIKIKIKYEGDHWIEKLFSMDWEHFTDDWSTNVQKLVDIAQGLANDMAQIWSNISQIALNNMQKELNAFKKSKDAELKIFNATKEKEKKSLAKQVKDGIISQEYYNAQLEQLEEIRAAEEQRIADEKETKELALKKEQFQHDKKAAITNAIIQGALGIATIWATAMQLGPIAGPIAAGLVSALIIGMTAAQVAAISSQPEPYQFGGFTGKKKKRLIQVNEDGEEWIASNKLLKDEETSPLIQVLEKYQRGNKAPLRDLMFTPPAVPDTQNMSQAASAISRSFTTTSSQTINNNYVTTELNPTNNEDMLAVIEKLYSLLDNPKAIPAIISREIQTRFDNDEQYLKQKARIG